MKECERAKKVQQLQDAVYGGGTAVPDRLSDCRDMDPSIGVVWRAPEIRSARSTSIFTSVFYFRVAKGTKDKEWAVVIIGLMYLKK